MTLKKTFVAFLFFTLLVVVGCKPTIVTPPKEFIETVPPMPESDEWHTLNSSSNEFGVKIIDGKLIIEKVKEINECDLKITDGRLIGIDRGEWGGQLKFRPDDPTKEIVDIKRGNVKFIFNFKDRIYFIEGLAHMGSSSGAIFELNKKNNEFSFTKILDFDDAPEAFTIYKDKFFIATHQNFYIIHNFKKQLIFQDTFWSSLYPNSIAVIDEKNVFIGIRSGIVKLDLPNNTLTFYKNDQ